LTVRAFIQKINPDVIILTHSTRINLDRLIMTLQPKIIVADASNYKTIQKIGVKLREKKIPFHATVEKDFINYSKIILQQVRPKLFLH
jgi:competence protein ComEC